MIEGEMVFVSLVATGFLWGITNPFLKIGTSGIEKIRDPNRITRTFKELFFLVTNWAYIIPFLINQCGSALYLFALQGADLKLAIPITNSLTFVFTIVGGWLVGEEIPDKRTVIGMLLILGGIICYILDAE
ncbi:Transmembrane protein 234 [Nesidiocoris tenuis]|uniref:Transmembrane protein 234 n=1 Tax=Nesidiocoris tenuis TaxID=355587 RepID=A0ABN7ARP0_9HEMI|nr:Transmembrane protein 234 [Nesidiocoris tenuis]